MNLTKDFKLRSVVKFIIVLVENVYRVIFKKNCLHIYIYTDMLVPVG